MRVAGGDARGRRLKGAVSPGTRATTERVRGAIFNILNPGQYEGCRVLDLYSGTGSLGIEALSRSADWADFVERDRRQCEVIEANLDATGYRTNAAVHRADVLKALPSLTGGYHLVLLDPPYKMEGLNEVLDAIASQMGLIVESGVVIAGHSKRLELGATYGNLNQTSHRQYGDNVVDFYSYHDPGQAHGDAEAGDLKSGSQGDSAW
jgi:16S rRNA (guanine966-N2)-methyltransferase